MGKEADITGSTGGIVILGQTPEARVLAELCASHGVDVVCVPDPDEDKTTEAASALRACGILIDARSKSGASGAASLLALEASLAADAVIAAVVVHRPVTPMARQLQRPDRFGGIALAMPLSDTTAAEIVSTPGTSGEAVARLQALLKGIGLNWILVRDQPGFFSGRVAGSFLNEAMALVGEGVPAALVESAAVECGMRTGPLAMLDAMSLKVPDEILHQELHDLEHGMHGEVPGRHGGGHSHVHSHEHEHPHEHPHEDPNQQTHQQAHGHGHAHDHPHHDDHGHDHGHEPADAPTDQKQHTHVHSVKSKRMPEPAVYVMEKMAHGFRRMGREAGAGFYDYEDDGSATLWSGLKAFERRTARIDGDDIRDRMLFIQALEAVRCREQGVVSSLEDADAASKSWGFPVSRGGVIGFINDIGTEAFVKRAGELAARYGDRFAPPPGLTALSRKNEPLTDSIRNAV